MGKQNQVMNVDFDPFRVTLSALLVRMGHTAYNEYDSSHLSASWRRGVRAAKHSQSCTVLKSPFGGFRGSDVSKKHLVYLVTVPQAASHYAEIDTVPFLANDPTQPPRSSGVRRSEVKFLQSYQILNAFFYPLKT